MNILATLDRCVNEVTSTKLYDEEGYDLVVVMTVNIIYEDEQEEREDIKDQTNTGQEQTSLETPKQESKQNLVQSLTDKFKYLQIQDEIAVQDLSKIEWEETNEVSCDASSYLKEEHNTQEIKQKPHK